MDLPSLSTTPNRRGRRLASFEFGTPDIITEKAFGGTPRFPPNIP